MDNHRNRRRVIVAAAAAALALGAESDVLAQQASGVTGGTTADDTSAGNANGGGMPQVQQQGPVSFVSGGVGLDESKALERAQSQWPLSLRFTGPGSDYLADVRVRIVDAHGADVLNTTSRGPYMLVALRPGRYTVHAVYKDLDQSKDVAISTRGGARTAFYWSVQ